MLRERVARTKRLIAAYEAAAKDGGPLFRMRIYSVEDLIFAPYDQPGPTLNLRPSGAGGFADEEFGEEPLEFFEIDQLVELIHSHVVPGSWEELLSTSISATERNLVVVHTAGAHARVSEFLRGLRSRSGRQISLEVEVVSLTDADRRALTGDGPVLADEALATLRGWIADGRARRLDAGRVLARNNQRVALVDLKPHAYVYDYDVEIAQGATIGDPLVNKFHEGLVVDVRPIVAGRGSHVVLECRLERAQLAGRIPKLETAVGTIELPVIALTRVGCTLSAPVDRTVVVGGALAGKAGVSAPLLLVTPRILSAR
jgi:hypothetical protein